MTASVVKKTVLTINKSISRFLVYTVLVISFFKDFSHCMSITVTERALFTHCI